MQKIQMPLLLFLELLVLALLGLAAAGPNMRNERVTHSTIVILDASYSMTARKGANSQSPQEKAINDLEIFFDTQAGYPIQFVLASTRPEVLSGRAQNALEAKEMLKQWKCNSPTAAIDAAISLGGNIGAYDAKYYIVTDQPPPEEIEHGKIIWKAFGNPGLENFAIVHASRVFQGEKDRILIEVANFSPLPARLQMTILDKDRNGVLDKTDETISPNEPFRIRSPIPDGVGPIEIRLAADSLEIDNRLTLLPPNRRPVRVMLGPLPGDMHDQVKRAVEVSGIARIVTERPEILITSRGQTVVATENSENAAESTNSADSDAPGTDPQQWTLRFLSGTDDETNAYLGPFIVDRSNPITNGISLEGVVWGASENVQMSGFPVIAAGNVPLITEQVRRGGVRDIQIQINNRYSTFTTRASWPILIYNILKYRMDQAHGIPVNNVRLGAEATFLGTPDDKTVQVTTPSGESLTLPLRNSMVPIPAAEVGVYSLKAPSGRFEFAVGALSPSESDLKGCGSGTYGGWLDEQTIRNDYHSVAWALLLASLVLMSLHLILLCGRPSN